MFVDVKFIGDIRLDGVSIEECTFDGCSFKNINFTKSIFKNVDFKKINARDDFSFNVKKINNCSFEGEMTGIRFGSSPISQTSFSGMLNDCSFFGHDQIEVVDLQKEIYKKIEPHEVANRMDLVDFSNASLVRCQFGNYCYLDKVIPPPIEENCISELTGYFYERIKDLVRKELPIDLSKKALMWLETFYKPDVRVPYGVIGPHDFKKSLGEVGALDFYKIFTLAAIECKTKV
ncbi:pentapeptide repeat-containing protein [Diaphorobacter aerolatus]|uniref:Pentapeptide repeat-containing protein n=1 Tax=Diaphorobacter aerolatus TaxID=1288495 RepID=A0A7H0GGX4_9BURK|nr:pentapeptide repeat-containing protein [Diaphorobacter aerolatus]QNP47540.1 pentapeptide repeat-containing protein [Diaphorobacter aerolatus]